jgi:hypothetical protein
VPVIESILGDCRYEVSIVCSRPGAVGQVRHRCGEKERERERETVCMSSMVYCVYNALRVLYSSFYSSSFFLLPSSLSGVARGQRTQPLCVRRWGERAAPHAMRVCTISRPYCASRGGGWRGRRGRRGRREGGRRDCCTCDTSKNTSEHGEDGHTWARVHRILAWQPPVPPVSAYRSDRRCGRERERERARGVF